jgi:DNA topoisomerase-3
MAGREIEREEVVNLLTTGKVGPLEGFRNKAGKPFAAVVIVNEKTEWKQKFDFDSGGSSEPAVIVNPEPIGVCPICKTGKVLESTSSFVCENVAGRKCTFRMGKTILQRDVPREQVAKLLTTGKTDLLHKFVSSKTRRAFSAYLKLEESGKVGFELGPREEKKAEPKARKPRPKNRSKRKAARGRNDSDSFPVSTPPGG